MNTAYVRRLNIVDDLVGNKWVKAKELAKKYGVSLYTIYDDIFMLLMNYDIEKKTGRYGGFRLTEESVSKEILNKNEERDFLFKIMENVNKKEKEVLERIIRRSYM